MHFCLCAFKKRWTMYFFIKRQIKFRMLCSGNFIGIWRTNQLKPTSQISDKLRLLEIELFIQSSSQIPYKTFKSHLLKNLYLKVDGVSHELNVAFATKQRNQNGWKSCWNFTSENYPQLLFNLRKWIKKSNWVQNFLKIVKTGTTESRLWLLKTDSKIISGLVSLSLRFISLVIKCKNCFAWKSSSVGDPKIYWSWCIK